MDFNSGELLLFDKPLRWTSFDLVRKVRNLTHAKTGHAGTLDPLATGLLILCTGKMTRKISEFQDLEKEYTGAFTLGITTPGYDREKPADATFPVDHITEQAIYDSVPPFTGFISQFPPPHSAVKIDGRRAYDLARKGREPEMKAREVHIKEFEITYIRLPEVGFRVVCSKGTYIRSLIHDFGKHLESGACLDSLRRTRIGSFRVEQAWQPDDFQRSLQGV
jgi:tRNA pseudouridine55 synthase